MYKYLIAASAFLITLHSYAQDDQVIKGAAYYVYENTDPKSGYIVMGSKHVTFYTHDGQKLVTLATEGFLEPQNFRLDPAAPRPQPATFRLISFPRIREQGPEGDWVAFFDKHGNRIKGYEYDKETQGLFIAFDQITKEEINVEFPLNDLEKIRSIQPRSNFRLDLSIVRSIK
jgi:hypothetical protein